MIQIDVYRIGWWTHAWWPCWPLIRIVLTGKQADGQRCRRYEGYRALRSRLTLMRRPHRPWQAEWPGCRRAVRGWTRNGTLRTAFRSMDTPR